MVLQEVMEHTHNGIGRVCRLIYEIIYLPWNGLAADSKYAALPWGQEIDGAGLEGVRGVVHLLGHVERVVHDRGQ